MKRVTLWALVVVAGAGALAGVVIAGSPSTPGGVTVTGVPESTTTEAPPAATTPSASTTPTTEPDSSTSSSSTTTTEPLAERADVRVVVANAARQPGLAGTTAEALRFLGYTSVVATDALGGSRQTRVLYAPGFGPEAERLAGDLALGTALIEPLGDEAVIPEEITGDVIVVLAADQAA